MSLKVLLTRKFSQTDILFLKERLESDITLVEPRDYDETSLVKEVSDIDVLFGPFISEKLLIEAKRLKFIQIPWTGVDSLNYNLLRKYSLTVCNSHSNSAAVAEHAVALMMAASKKIAYHDRIMRKGNWNKVFNDSQITPFSKPVTNSNIGFIGFGAIAKNIYSITQGFGCNYYAFTNTGKAINSYMDVEFKTFSLFKKNARNLDYLFICVPLTNSTRGFINREILNCLSTKCILINISRGEVIDEESLFRALNERIIHGAGIDTWYNYPNKDNPQVFPSKNYNFHLLDNLILSPHRAGYLEGDFPHLNDAIENLNRANNGLELINRISIEKEY